MSSMVRWSALYGAILFGAISASALPTATLQEVRGILEAGLSEAEADLSAAKVAGNTTRQARAIAARQAYQHALDSLDAKGVPEFPSNIRRELRPTIEAVQARIQDIIDNAPPEEEPPPADDQPSESGTPSDTPPKDAGTTVDAGTPRVEEAPAVFATSGAATSWAPLLGVAVTIQDVDVVSIPVVGVRQRKTLTFPGGYGDIPAAITPIENVLGQPAANTVIAFRALTLPGFPSPEIMEWPSDSNRWTLRLRCRPGDNPAKPVAMRLEIDARARGLTALQGGAASGGTAGSVAVTFDTRPTGAVVLINGQPLRGPDGKAMRTPCEVLLPPEGVALEFRRAGYLDKSFPNVRPPKESRPITIPLIRDPDFIDKTIELKAASASALPGIQFKQGRKYRITIEGSWSCNAEKTLVDAGGYPLDKHPSLYLDPSATPRLTTSANFGALLYTIGKDPEWRPLPSSAIVTATATGPLRFEINEGGGPKNRTDNTGSLTIRITAL